MKKYELTSESKNVTGVTLYRIKALRDFSIVKAGDLGGWVESESNLSHEGDSWVYDEARVFGNSRVFGHARVFGNARVSGNSWVHGNSRVSGNSCVYENTCVFGDAWVHENARVSGQVHVFGNSRVFGHALVYGNAQVYGNAWVYGNSRVSGNSCVYGHAWVYGNARVSGNSHVYGNAYVSGQAYVYGDAQVYENAVIEQNMHVKFSSVTKDLTLRENILQSINSQCNLISTNKKIYCYKHVREDLTSLFDSKFQYTVGDYAVCEDADISNTSCSSGLHVSHASFWNGRGGEKVLLCEVSIDDIITVQEGKIRCKKLLVLGICDGDVFK